VIVVAARVLEVVGEEKQEKVIENDNKGVELPNCPSSSH